MEHVNAFMPKSCFDVGKISPNFKKTCWLEGCSPDYLKHALAPNAAGFFKLRVLGETQLRLVAAGPFKESLASIAAKDFGSCEEAEAFFMSMTKSQVSDLAFAGCTVYSTTLKANEMIYVPTGFLVLEHASRGQLIHGVRKSFFQKSELCMQNIAAVVSWMSSENGTKIQEVLDAMRAAP